jgi:D-ribose pyranose/furanose isomerase RbsD
MKKLFIIVQILFTIQMANSQTSWQEEFAKQIPALGHRNWVLVVDAAYPLQSNPGITTIVTGADQLEVVKKVLEAIKRSPNITPEIFLDKEIDFVPEKEASGIKDYKKQLDRLLKDEKVDKVLHEKLISDVDEAAKLFNILVLKTNLTIPYTSVFIRLDCGYWNAEQEQKMRELMK